MDLLYLAFSDGVSTAQALSTLQFTAAGQDTRAAYSGASDQSKALFYTWNVLSSVCGIATSNSTSSNTTALELKDIGSFTVCTVHVL